MTQQPPKDLEREAFERARVKHDAERMKHPQVSANREVQGLTSASFTQGWRAARAAQSPLDVREALKFYADPISYMPTQVNEPRTAVHGDNGRRARKALSSSSSGEK
jgi:hypothetical protein